MPKALLYLRVSTKEQEREGYSLDAQRKLAHEYTKKHGLEIVKTWEGPESAWGQKTARIKFNQMIDYARQHPEIEHIIFDITDRMTRNDTDKIKINILIQDFGKTIHFSRTNKIYNKNSNSDEFFMLDIEIAVAKKMSADISRKTKMGQKEKAEQGQFPTVAPLGYLNNPQTHLIDVDKERAPYIQKAFTLMSTGSYSLEMLNDLLYKQGLRSKKGNGFSKSSLHRTLHNTFYYGIFTIQGRTYQGVHEPLISQKLFEEVQAVMHGKDRVQPHIQKRGFAFSNLASCQNCGCKVLGEIKKERYVYYHCSYSKGRQKACVPYITESGMTDIFAESVRSVTLPDEIVGWLKRNLKEYSAETNSLRDTHIMKLHQEHSTANNRLERLFDMRLDNEINDELFKQKKNELESTLVNLKNEMRSAERINPNFYEDGVRTLELSNSLYPQYLSANLHDKAVILKTIASNYVLNGVSVAPTYRKPFSVFAEGLVYSKWGGGAAPLRYDLSPR